jgi:hypothetical protein
LRRRARARARALARGLDHLLTHRRQGERLDAIGRRALVKRAAATSATSSAVAVV